MDDDGFVLLAGHLIPAEWVSRACAQAYIGCDGRDMASIKRRYTRCYPVHDNTTPSLADWKGLHK